MEQIGGVRNMSIEKGAGIGKRIGAFLLDALIVGLINGVFAFVVALFTGDELLVAMAVPEYASTSWAYRLVMIANPVIMVFYGWIQENGKHNATFGKRVAKIIVAGKNGNEPRSLDVLVRNVMKAFPTLITAIFTNSLTMSLIAGVYEIANIIVVLASKKHRGIHDRIADTMVIHKEDKWANTTDDVQNINIVLPTPAEIEANRSTTDERTVAPMANRSLVALGGQYCDAQFPLDLPIVMGRDSKQCNIVFAADTKGVSKVHCEIKVTNGKVLITDLGSTYGTMINNEVSLRANETVELHTGDQFRIGKYEVYMVK